MNRPARAGHGPIFESTRPEGHRQAAAICATCPLIATCSPSMWGATYPVGTWGGVLYGDKGRRAVHASTKPLGRLA